MNNQYEDLILNKKSSLQLLRILWSFFSNPIKKRIYFGFFLTATTAFLEVISVSIILPFITVITEPEKFMQIERVKYFMKTFGIESLVNMRLGITISLVLIVIIALLIRLFTLRYTTNLGAFVGAELSRKALRGFLTDPYEVQVARNTGAIISTINQNVDGSAGAITFFFDLIVNLVISLSIVLALYFINNAMTLITLITLLVLYLVLTANSQKKIKSCSKQIVVITPFREKSLLESISAVREVILSNLADFYLKRFYKFDKKKRSLYAKTSFYIGSFRFIVEATIIFIVAVLLLLFTSSNFDFSLAVFGTFAIGAQKLLPSLQTIFRMWAQFKSKRFQMIETIKVFSKESKKEHHFFNKKLPFKETIELLKVEFSYEKSNSLIFSDINMKINKGDCIGLMGPSGAGKTTLSDILMTLLIPQKGKILIDNIDILKDIDLTSRWKLNVAHVPQDIFLSDESFKENIAFGEENSEINYEKVVSAAKMANISSFIESLPSNYETRIGDRGGMLSGGQRQRIAIARALYRESEFLVLDEATSALDNKTEDNIMNTIKNIKGNITIVLIAHRLRTLEICDEVYKVESGKVIKLK